MARMGLAARGRRRPATERQGEIARVGRAARAKGQGPEIQRLPGGNLPKQGPMPQRGGKSGGGLGGAAMPGPGGAQLMRRVQSGAITQGQAQQTMKERQSLRKAFGPDFREKFGGVGAFREARQKLTDNPNNPKLLALNKRLQSKRAALVEAARKKIGGEKSNGGTEAPPRRRGRSRRVAGRGRAAY